MGREKTRVLEAIRVLKNGGIVIFPTDTAFGIGCRIDDEKAIKKLFNIRKRPKRQATPVLADTFQMAQEYLLPVPKDVIDKLIKPYWPGAITIILPCKTDMVGELVRGGGTTLGIRIPNHPVALKLIKGVGVPILGPSANFHGEKTPYSFSDLSPDIIRLVDYVIPGETSGLKQSSTVIDCSTRPWRIVRSGAIRLKKSIILFINTASSKEILVGLRINNKEYVSKKQINHQKAQVVLPLVEKMLKKHNLSVGDIQSIEVSPGPGSFTGIRVGIAIANALSFALKIK